MRLCREATSLPRELGALLLLAASLLPACMAIVLVSTRQMGSAALSTLLCLGLVYYSRLLRRPHTSSTRPRHRTGPGGTGA